MARKTRSIFVCQNCGYRSGKWLGRCPDCGEWNRFLEEIASVGEAGEGAVVGYSRPMRLEEVASRSEEKRLPTGFEELDRVLGGGLYPGSVILLAGEPGIGKSTLMLQVAAWLQARQVPVLYVSAEESLPQLKTRASRLRPDARNVMALAETRLPAVVRQMEALLPGVVIVDSIQSLYHPDLNGAAGNASQLKECAGRLFRFAKEHEVTLVLIGHVTKEGVAAGPRLLEHLVDATLYFEGNLENHRIIRSHKNRFGPSGELAVFEMGETGLRQVVDLSTIFLSSPTQFSAGTAVVCAFEGTRPLMVEVQALVNRTAFGPPQRTASGFDQRRLALILAILQRFADLEFGTRDVFLKIAGGLNLRDPALDLGVALAIFSSLSGQPLSHDEVFLGELGLGGEIRAVPFLEARLREIELRGFRQVFLPASSFATLSRRQWGKLLLSPVERIGELITQVDHP